MGWSSLICKSVLFCACMLSIPQAFAFAEDKYPVKPIKVIVPYGAGGSSDMSARLVLQAAEKYIGERIAIVNIAGGGSTIGSMEVLNAKPDGYTLLWQIKSLITSNVTGLMNAKWSDFTPVANAALFEQVLTVHKEDTDLQTFEAIAAKSKAEPETITFPVNLGTGTHFGALAVERAAGGKFHILAGGGDATNLNEQLGRRANLALVSIPVALPHIQAGTLIPIAVGGINRDPSLPKVPTFKELGYDVTTTFHLGIYGPKDLPAEVVSLWESALKKVMEDPSVVAELAKQSLYPAYMSQTVFTEHLGSLEKDLYDLAQRGNLLP